MEKFKHTEQTKKVFNTIIEAYSAINSDSDIEQHGLTYDDYKSNDLGLILDGLRFEGEIETDNERIAKWLKSFNCNVCIIANGWKVQL